MSHLVVVGGVPIIVGLVRMEVELMQRVTSVVLTKKETKQLIQRVNSKLPLFGVYVTGSLCDACGSEIPDDQHPVTGFASGEELGLCRGCASYVNTDADMNGQRDKEWTPRQEASSVV